MTTIIVRNGTVYSDTQWTVSDRETDETLSCFVGRKIHKQGNLVIAGSGRKSIVDIALKRSERIDLYVRRFLRMNWFWYWSWGKECTALNAYASGDSTVLLIGPKHIWVADITAKPIRTFLWKRFKFVNFKVKWRKLKTDRFRKADKNHIIIGSGSDHAEHWLREGYDPATAIKLTAQADSATNSLVDTHTFAPLLLE